MRSIEREFAGVAAFEVKEVEGEESEGVAGAFLEGGLEVGEIGGAVFFEDDDLPVEGDGFDGEAGRLRRLRLRTRSVQSRPERVSIWTPGPCLRACMR